MRIRDFGLCSLVILTVGLTGCGGGLGAKGYACEGLPSHPLCLSAADIYALTDGDGPPPAERRQRQGNIR